MTDTTSLEPPAAVEGATKLTCHRCRTPLTAEDMNALGLRVPDPTEAASEYCDAELVEPGELHHVRCTGEPGVR